MLWIDDGTTNNRAILRRTTGQPSATGLSGGVSQWSNNFSAASSAQGVVLKMASSMQAGSQTLASNGTIANTTGATMPVSPTTLHIGENSSGTAQFMGYITRVAFFNNYFLPGLGDLTS